jgi:phenylacetyl-CoA:acceptor oxidoreductase subunit 2
MNVLQTNWDARAALNFMGGGAGAGLIVAAAVLGLPYASIALALVLIGCGLSAVWFELGKPLRALHVFFNPFTSWMTRESFAAVLVFALGIGTFFMREIVFGMALAAALFLYCQARMLHASKGIPAWRAPGTVMRLVTTGLAEGAGLALLFDTSGLALSLFALALIARALAGCDWLATLVALALAAIGSFVPYVAAIGGLVALATGWHFKFTLVTRASHKQGFALPRLPVRGTR